uniref:transcription factor Adf-1-like isoform X2 n=1 Tax=Ciona intestinalis TaxID=7719 RepID=UPI0005213B41|nr:transcription factor Adf-1-like isoform X2 [Ciona intestinalis]|eukprot:XP_009860382.1 transcription factor Adf-1-like isoform X2 [Ciona intestinalis]
MSTKDFNETLIELVRKNPLIYQSKNRFHKDKKKRNSCWGYISSELEQPVECCATRWRSLRDRFLREQKKLENTGSTTWDLYPQLLFLNGHLRRRTNITTTASDVENTPHDHESQCEEDTSEKETTNLEILTTASFDSPESSTETLPPVLPGQHRKRKRDTRESNATKNDFQEQLLNVLLSNKTEPAPPQFHQQMTEDVYDNFGKIVALRLRQLPASQADETMIYIMQHLASVT